jgi:hypothetical protein
MPKLVMRFILIIVFFYSICSFGQSSSNMSWTKNVGTRKFPASKTIFRVNDFGKVSDTSVVSTKAIDALMMNVQTNTYLVNGHNYQDDRLRLYLPGNGGLLSAVALMCAGYDGCKEKNPGIPKNGKWKVKWEGLKRLP